MKHSGAFFIFCRMFEHVVHKMPTQRLKSINFWTCSLVFSFFSPTNIIIIIAHKTRLKLMPKAVLFTVQHEIKIKYHQLYGQLFKSMIKHGCLNIPSKRPGDKERARGRDRSRSCMYACVFIYNIEVIDSNSRRPYIRILSAMTLMASTKVSM